ncbi:GGDEF domain-containing protein [Solidesulfovibrio sp.]
MNLTDQDLAIQLKITRLDIKRRKELLGFTEHDAEILAELKPEIGRELSSIVDEFYDDQITKPEIERTIGDSGTLSRLKHHMSNYVLDMFSGVYDDIYILSRLRIGLVHDRIGVSPVLYISSVRTLFQILRKRLVGNLSKNCKVCHGVLGALEKVLLFDLTLVMDTYIFSLLKQVSNSRSDLENYAKSLEEEVVARTKELIEISQTDPLTRLKNRRAFFDELRREVARAIRRSRTFVVAYIDLDKFKQVNDSLGHLEGDKVLICLADAMRTSLRIEDFGARIGGDEFAVIVSDVDIIEAKEVVGRLFAAFDSIKNNSPVTLSVGLSVFNLDYPQLPDVLTKEADMAMYEAKKIGGNSVVLFSQL